MFSARSNFSLYRNKKGKPDSHYAQAAHPTVDAGLYDCTYNSTLSRLAEFDWDQGNRSKCQKHGVSLEEIEWALSRPVAVYPSPLRKESRSFAIGKNSGGRYIFAVFTTRQKDGPERIRPISARYMHQKEIDHYEQKTKKASGPQK